MTDFTMPRIGDIVARIEAQVAGFSTVACLLDLDVTHLLGAAAALPAAVVAPLPPAALGGELMSTVHSQTVDWRCGVFILLHRRLVGGPAADAGADFDDLAAALRLALAGWAPPGEGARLRWAGGALEAMAPGLMVWRDDYQCRRMLRHTSPPNP